MAEFPPPERKQLSELISYSNFLTGHHRDHLATTWKPINHTVALTDYHQIDVLGYVVPENHDVECDCLVRIEQVVDDQPGLGGQFSRVGLFGRIDHKLVIDGDERSSLFESYTPTGESFFCVAKEGHCGASVPMYRWLSINDVDNFVTTRNLMSLQTDPSILSKGILCYIWPGAQAGFIDPESAERNLNPLVPPDFPVIKPQKACDPINESHGQWTYSSLNRLPGTVALLNCHTGYSLSPPTITAVVCQRNGNWQPPRSTCHVTGCPLLDANATEGRVVYSQQMVGNEVYPLTSTATLVCSDQMDIGHQGADVVYCTDAGWQPPRLGICEKTCPLIHVEHGQVAYSDLHGFEQNAITNRTTASVICNPGTVLVGKGTAMCIGGKWTVEKVGECQKQACPTIKVNKGRVTYHTSPTGEALQPPPPGSKVLPGVIVRLTCPGDSQLSEASEAVCHSSESWQPTLGHCQ